MYSRFETGFEAHPTALEDAIRAID